MKESKYDLLWINGPFGAGKTSLAQKLLQTLPNVTLYDPELLGQFTRVTVPMPKSEDYQDCAMWRTLVVSAAVAIRKEVDGLIVVPMTLVNDTYIAEIFGGLRLSGLRLAHFFLDVPEAMLRSRISAQTIHHDDSVKDERVRQWRLAQIDRCAQARASLPANTIVLDASQASVNELAVVVSDSIAGERNLSQSEQ
jgi:hypothetical protein